MLLVFKHPSISKEEKDYFIEGFCRMYFSDENFRNHFDGQFLYFKNGIFDSVVDNPYNINCDEPKISRIAFPIGLTRMKSLYGRDRVVIEF